MLDRVADFRRRQRSALRESNRSHRDEGPEGAPAEHGVDGAGEPDADTVHDPDTGHHPHAERDDAEHDAAKEPDSGSGSPRYGRAGAPLNRRSPLYMGFVGAFGALLAIGLWHVIGRLTTTLTILVIALFLTVALDPIVESLRRRGVKRGAAVTLVFVGVLVVFTLLGLVVVPPVATQGTALARQTPDYLQHVLNTRWVQDFDKSYHVVDKIQSEFTKKVQDAGFMGSVFGGVLGVGIAVASGVFQAFTVLILTLYFLVSLPSIKRGAYAMVPTSRRRRVSSLTEEVLRRTGSYAIGQAAVASINAIASWIMMTLVGIPYSAVLAVAVGLFGLVPMVGATIGAVLVCLVAFFDEPHKAVIAALYYLVYQQLENYLIAPRIMRRTVSVPGAVTVIAALAGGTLLGVLGALLAIPAAGAMLLLYEEVLVPRQRKH